jgi:hypothetical protein
MRKKVSTGLQNTEDQMPARYSFSFLLWGVLNLRAGGRRRRKDRGEFSAGGSGEFTEQIGAVGSED